MNKDPRTASELAATYESQIKGKIVLTTGVSLGGIGAAFVLGIAQSQPALLILADRNLTKIQQTANAVSATGVQVRILELDLVSLASVRASAEKVMNPNPRYTNNSRYAPSWNIENSKGYQVMHRAALVCVRKPLGQS